MSKTAQPSAEKGATFRFRWTVPVEIVVTVEVGTDEFDSEDPFSVEEYAYARAVERAKDRLDEAAATINGVAVHGDIDGVGADNIEQVYPPDSQHDARPAKRSGEQ